MRHCLNSLLLTLQRPACTDSTTDTVTSRKSTTDRRHTASQPDGACKQTHTNTTPRTAPLVPRGIIAHHTVTMTTARTRQLTYRLRRHRPAPCRNICPMGRAGWKQPSIIMPRPVSRPPDQHHTTTMNNHARIQWVGWRTNEQTSARKKDVHGCSNERKYAAESKITVSERPESYAMNDVRSQTQPQCRGAGGNTTHRLGRCEPVVLAIRKPRHGERHIN